MANPIEAVIAGYLRTYPALATIHSGRACQGLAPQDWVAPYQVLYLVSDTPGMRRVGILRKRIQVSSFAPKYGVVQEMADPTVAAIDGFSGIIDGVTIKQSIYLGVSMDYEPDTMLHQAITDFYVIYNK